MSRPRDAALTRLRDVERSISGHGRWPNGARPRRLCVRRPPTSVERAHPQATTDSRSSILRALRKERQWRHIAMSGGVAYLVPPSRVCTPALRSLESSEKTNNGRERSAGNSPMDRTRPRGARRRRRGRRPGGGRSRRRAGAVRAPWYRPVRAWASATAPPDANRARSLITRVPADLAVSALGA